ncbi:MAG: hypothetical protein AABZ55_00950, partial [Bdellovibrionota bacterium]
SYIVILGLFGYSDDSIKATLSGRYVNRNRFNTYINNIKFLGYLDINGDGISDALSDGMILHRFLLGVRGDALADGLVSANSLRKTGRELEDRIVANVLNVSSLRCY